MEGGGAYSFAPEVAERAGGGWGVSFEQALGDEEALHVVHDLVDEGAVRGQVLQVNLHGMALLSLLRESWHKVSGKVNAQSEGVTEASRGRWEQLQQQQGKKNGDRWRARGKNCGPISAKSTLGQIRLWPTDQSPPLSPVHDLTHFLFSVETSHVRK